MERPDRLDRRPPYESLPPGQLRRHRLGFWLIAAAWKVLHEAAQHDRLATTGPYAHVRHPQYDGFLLVMIGFLLQWPTVPTLIMFPILVYVYARLARSEVAQKFGDDWAAHAAHTPAFWPRFRKQHGTPAQPVRRSGPSDRTDGDKRQWRPQTTDGRPRSKR